MGGDRTVDLYGGDVSHYLALTMSFPGLSFHLYGFIVGLATVIVWFLAELQARSQRLSLPEWEKLIIASLVGGLIGARLHYVLTNWTFYQADLVSVLAVWQGGLSILGAVWGGVIALWIAKRLLSIKLPVISFLDTLAFGLPIGQAVGRLGNWVNQELYGLPSSLPWAIYIDPVYRQPIYQQSERYHPLFAYEMLALLLIGGWLWFYSGSKIGSGKPFLFYILSYSFIRFLLDFIRIDNTHVLGSFLGANQIILLLVMIISSWLLYHHSRPK